MVFMKLWITIKISEQKWKWNYNGSKASENIRGIEEINVGGDIQITEALFLSTIQNTLTNI